MGQLSTGTTLILSGVCEPTTVYPEARGVLVDLDPRDYGDGMSVAGAYAARLGLPEVQIHHVDDIHLETTGGASGAMTMVNGSNCSISRQSAKRRCDVTAQTDPQQFYTNAHIPSEKCMNPLSEVSLIFSFHPT